MAKKVPVTAESLAAEIKRQQADWQKIYKRGTTDPFYADGVNLNLVRSQIISAQDRLADLCKAQKLKACPVEAKQKPPRLVSETYMAPGSKAAKHAHPPVRRAKKT